jgi:iron complex transport system permease protein
MVIGAGALHPGWSSIPRGTSTAGQMAKPVKVRRCRATVSRTLASQVARPHRDPSTFARKVRSIPIEPRPRISLPARGAFFSRALPFGLCLLLLGAAFAASIAIGAVSIPPAQLWSILLNRPDSSGGSSALASIIWDLRLPRTVFVMLLGMALASSGAAFQGVFRNPLADPYLLGIGSGASLGVAIAITIPGFAATSPVIPVFAFLGALGIVVLVYGWSRPGRDAASSTRLILSGVAAGAFAQSMAAFLFYRTVEQTQRAISWLMGGLLLGGWEPVRLSLPYILIGIFILFAMGRVLNLLQFGEEQAEQTGLNVSRARWILILAASLTTAAGVAFGGVIGFIGLAVPHLARLLWGGDYRRLLPLATLLGASVLLLADLLARTLIAPQQLPVGIVTALLGAPFFFYLLRRNDFTK